MKFGWRELMRKWNQAIFSDKNQEYKQYYLSQEALASNWAGKEPASEAQIAELERKLGYALPPSYRSFLRFTNSWELLTHFIYKLYSTDEVDWFRVRHEGWIESLEKISYTIPVTDREYLRYGKDHSPVIRVEYVRDLLQISEKGDAAVFVLNPRIIHGKEWEAWFLTNWGHGVRRYKSFWDLMCDEYDNFIYLLDNP